MVIATVNASRISRIIKEFPRETEGELNAWLNKNARTLVSSSGENPGLLQVTPPHSQGKKGTAAKIQGEAAVTRDVWRVYASPGRVWQLLRSYSGEKVAAQWWKLFRENRAKAIRYLELEAPSAIQSMKIGFDGGAEHQRNRGRNGRVKSGKPKRIVLTDTDAVKKYIRANMKKVGLLASSVPSAAGGKLGKLKGVPAWVSRHPSTRYGYVRERNGRNKRVIFIGITNGAINEMQRRFTEVLKYRLGAMEREIPYVARALEKKLAARLRA